MSRKQEVCRDFQRGHCRFGARCKYLHVLPQQQQQQQQQRGFSNFSGFQQRSDAFQSVLGRAGSQQQQPQQSKSHDHKCIDVRLCKNQIKEDFSLERPSFWRLTCYGHAKYLPNDVAGDVSSEELRANAYTLARQGMSIQQVAQREAEMVARKSAEFEALLNNPYNGPVAAPVVAAPGRPSPFLNPLASPSPFLTPGMAASVPFGQPFTVPGFGEPQHIQQQVQAAAPRSPFQSFSAAPGVAGIGVPKTAGLFQAISPFGVPAQPGFFSSNPFSSAQPSPGNPFSSAQLPSGNPFSSAQPPSGNPFSSLGQPSPGNPFSPAQPSPVNPFSSPISLPASSFSAAQALSPFSLFKDATHTSPLSSQFTVMPPGLSTTGIPSTTSLPNGSARALGSGEVSGDIWTAESWSLGGIPEEEPPIHLRRW